VHSTENARHGGGERQVSDDGASGAARAFAGAVFLTTVANWEQLPSAGAPEVAFAGRSNAGKSSAINALVGRGDLARVSRTPGRTQHLNFFQLRTGALLVDLPGYGYAAASEQARRNWGHLVTRYLSLRSSLVGLVLVADSRRPLTRLDHQLLDWFLPTNLPVRILLTKADKLLARERALALERVHETLARLHSERGGQFSAQLFSASHRWGVAEATAAICEWLACIRSDGTKRKAPASRGVTRGRKRPAIGEDSQP
jgi:GTP-binding protein